MSKFTVIPVLDLKDGVVVHARGGKRADYRPLETPFGTANDPLDDRARPARRHLCAGALCR